MKQSYNCLVSTRELKSFVFQSHFTKKKKTCVSKKGLFHSPSQSLFIGERSEMVIRPFLKPQFPIFPIFAVSLFSDAVKADSAEESGAGS